MNRSLLRLALALAVVLAAPCLLFAQDGERVTHEASTASVPAPIAAASLELAPPPSAETADQWEARLSDHLRPGPIAEASAEALAEALPAMPLNTPVTSTAIQLLENRTLADSSTNDVTSTVLEPSVAVRGNEILYTGNWFASFSTDGGSSFAFVNPGGFPAIPNQPFCCDQVAIYDDSRDLMMWFLQYVEDGSQNTFRIAVARGADIPAQQWRLYDFTPLGVGGWNNEWFDFPEMALGDDFLYVTTNAFSTVPGGGFTRAVILRLPLDAMANNQPLNYAFFDSTQDFSLRPTHGATDTMYFANHVSTARIRVFEWPESGTTLTSAEIVVQPWSAGNNGGDGPDGPWLGRADPRITAAWLSGTTAGFAWNAAQDANFDHPHVRAALVDVDTMTLTGQPHLWNDDFAYAYPAASPNGDGDIGISVAFGGGVHHPSHAVGTFTAPGAWDLIPTVAGTNSPAGNRWGDYLTVRPDPTNADAWYATGYSLQGGRDRRDIEPRLVRFRRGGGPQVTVDNLQPGTRLGNGDSTTIRATVTDAAGSPATGETVTFSVVPGGLVDLSPTSATTNAAGVAEITATAITSGSGTATVTGTAAGVSDDALVEVPDLSAVALIVLLTLLGVVGIALRRRGGTARS